MQRLIDAAVMMVGTMMVAANSGLDSSSSGMGLETLIKDYGALAGIVIYFIYRDQMRESRMAKRINENEDFIKKELMEIAKTSSQALESVAEAIEYCKKRNGEKA